MSDRTLFAVPHDDARAVDLAIRDAQRSREAWILHRVARRRCDRECLAETAKLLESRVIDTANALIERTARGGHSVVAERV